MRDDIHKSAPVGRYWKTFIKHCNREADRKERAAESAVRAIVHECKQELSGNWLSAIKAQSSSPQGSLFGNGIQEVISASQSNPCNSVLAQNLIMALHAVQESCSSGDEALRMALKNVTQDRLDAKERAIKGHIQKVGGKEAGLLIQTVEKILHNCSTDNVVDCLLNQTSDDARSDNVDNEENLL